MIPASLAIGHHPFSRAVTPERGVTHGLALDRQAVEPMHDAFAPMINAQRYDLCELAIVSAMQAVAFGKPLVLLPVTLAARFQHGCLVRSAERAPFGPNDLAGRTVAVRAYTQTTGAWVRTILQTEYGVDSRSVRWITQTGAHLPDYEDPPFVRHVGRGPSLLDLLRTGEADAAIFGNDLPDLPWIVPVIPDAAAAGAASAVRTGIVPVNHILSVSRRWADGGDDRLARVMALFREAKDAAFFGAASDGTADRTADGRDLYPLGIEAMRPSVEALLRSAFDQGLIPRAMTVDELFAGSPPA